MRILSFRPALLVALGAIALFIANTNADAATISTNTPVSVTCTSAGQECDNSYQQNATTSSFLTLEFQSAWDSCGSFSVAFLVDGVQVYVSQPLAAFQSTGVIDVSPVTFGAHVLEVRATGVPGGCNSGTLQSWAGRFIMTTTNDSPPPGPDPEPSSGPVDASECKKGGWESFTDPSFKNQGDCVSWVHSRRP